MPAKRQGRTTSKGNLDIVARSHQSGSSRYRGVDPDQIPHPQEWRNNLTALSQRYDLLFIAYADEVHIFRPSFPDQKVPSSPLLILYYSDFAEAYPGYINLYVPNAANHIIVGDLGDDEVLLIACDNGNVVGYRTQPIESRIRQPGEDAIMGCVEPFFIQNVGATSWGLAIHQTARLIAISSNTQKILVFAFALDSAMPIPSPSRRAGEESNEEDEKTIKEGYRWRSGDTWSCHMCRSAIKHTPKLTHCTDTTPPPRIDRRKHNVVLCLAAFAHETNIPNIAFYNSGSSSQDETIYLASTDISGTMFIWDVWRAQRIFCMDNTTLEFSVVDSNYGWGVLCLDPNIGQCHTRLSACYGTKAVGPRLSGLVLDNSACVGQVEDTSQIHPIFKRVNNYPTLQGNPPAHAVTTQTWMDVIMDNNPLPGLGEANDATSILAGEVDEWISDHDDISWDGDDGLDLHYVGENGEGVASSSLETPEIPSENDSVSSGSDRVDNPSDWMDMSTDGSVGRGLTETEDVARHEIEPEFSGSCCERTVRQGKLPFNLLVTSRIDICLLQDLPIGNTNGPPADSLPIHGTLCRGPLHQILPHTMSHLTHFDRLNMLHQIPSLGVVLTATQAGRVAVLALTQWRPSRHDRATRPYIGDVEKLAGFKVVAILPTYRQEEEGRRPEKPLLGMAVGPLPGDHGGGRWRLLMTYMDGTVLSYEISKRMPGGELLIV